MNPTDKDTKISKKIKRDEKISLEEVESEPTKKKEEQVQVKKTVSTRIIENDVFADVLETETTRFVIDQGEKLQSLWESNPDLHKILQKSKDVEDARNRVYEYLGNEERNFFALDNQLHILSKAVARDCINVMRSIIGPINEKRTGHSALTLLWQLAQEQEVQVSIAFLMEFINLFRGVRGRANIYRKHEWVKKGIPGYLKLEGREAAIKRSEKLDEMSERVRRYFKRYPSGLDDEIVEWRKQNKKRILNYFKATEKDWKNYKWHLKNVIKTAQPVFDLIELPPNQQAAIEKAVENKIPFGITPYYLSLMNNEAGIGYDNAVRAQVLPPPLYVKEMIKNRERRDVVFDFMGEHDTSPIDLVTRRYPFITILKPFNTCPQICVYCQRNWEIDECMAPQAMARRTTLKAAIKWIKDHPTIGEILITGGDPLVLSNKQLEWLLKELSDIDHIYRIRIGSRTLVTLPFRLTDSLIKMFSKYAVPGKREIVIVTHFAHSYEITPECMEVVQKIKQKGISVYNQQVFTVENSRRFETAKLRMDLRSIGVDPYYTFNMKGKKETKQLMVPIARILQERKEEARLLPGLDRTDEPVFNVPRLGKNHLRSVQDRRLVMIKPDGARIYELHPWEKNITPMPPYNYTDVPIFNYLEELAARGENLRDYRTIWFYY